MTIGPNTYAWIARQLARERQARARRTLAIVLAVLVLVAASLLLFAKGTSP